MISAIDFDRPGTALFAGPGQVVGFEELGRWVAADRELIRKLDRPAVAFMFGPSGAPAVAAYLACLAERLPLGLGEPAPELRDRVLASYRPSVLIMPRGEAALGGYSRVGDMAGGELVLFQANEGAYPIVPHADLALLLATSGSTGTSKFVRLSLANLEANARAIASYLGLGPGEVAIQSLPLHYSYGLSVLNSHLVAGGAVALTGHSFMRPEFWNYAGDCRCTSFAGVPYMYETLQRLRLSPFERRSMRAATQAGGHLRTDLVRQFNEAAVRAGGRFFVMYGQTEATARMAYVPPERLAEKTGSIGLPLPGGELWLEPPEKDSELQQLHYRGANVMLGYASAPADLGRGDELGGRLATGDLAECDSDGFFRLTGRLARFAKLFGKRVDLVSLETEVESVFRGRAAILDGGDRLDAFIEAGPAAEPLEIRTYLYTLLGVPPGAVRVEVVKQLPLTATGKKDYKALK